MGQVTEGREIKPGAGEHLGLHFKLECFLFSHLSLSENLNLEICVPHEKGQQIHLHGGAG